MRPGILTVLSRLLNERVNTALAIVPLRGHCGNVVPSHGLDDIHHGLSLVGVWGHHTGEEVIAGVVTQLWGRGGVAHLGDLHRREHSIYNKIEATTGEYVGVCVCINNDSNPL